MTKTQGWEERDRHFSKHHSEGISGTEFPVRPLHLNSAGKGKWQAFPLEAATQGMSTSSHAPEFHFLVESREPGYTKLGGKSDPEWQFFRLWKNVINLTELNRSLTYLLLSRWMGSPEIHVYFFSWWKQTARPKLRKGHQWFHLLSHFRLRGWFFFLVLFLFFKLRYPSIACPHLFSSGPVISGWTIPCGSLDEASMANKKGRGWLGCFCGDWPP